METSREGGATQDSDKVQEFILKFSGGGSMPRQTNTYILYTRTHISIITYNVFEHGTTLRTSVTLKYT